MASFFFTKKWCLSANQSGIEKVYRFSPDFLAGGDCKSLKPKLLSAEVKNSYVILPLLAKALYEFGFFEGIFVRIGQTIRRITVLFFTLALSSFVVKPLLHYKIP